MNLNQGLTDLVAVGLVAVLAPIVIALLPGPRVPQVVIFLFGGVLIGPHVLGLAETSAIQLLANVGLGFLFLLAGYELDPALLRQRPGKLAMAGWAHLRRDRGGRRGRADRDRLHQGLRAGRAGADDHGPGHAAAHPAGQRHARRPVRPVRIRRGRCRGALPHPDHRGLPHPARPFRRAGLGSPGRGARPRPNRRTLADRHRVVQRIVQEGQDETAQITLRGAMVLLFVLLAVASRFGLDVVLGALLAGMVLRAWARQSHMDVASLEHKFDAVGYGIFIPIFFISSGMSLDLKAIARDPLRLLLFFVMLLVVRGLPSLLVYRRVLPAAATGRDDVHYGHHAAAADRPGRHRPAGRGHASLYGRGAGRRGRPGGPGLPPHRGEPAPVGAAHTRGRRDPRGRICRRDQPGARQPRAARPRGSEPASAGLTATGCLPGCPASRNRRLMA